MHPYQILSNFVTNCFLFLRKSLLTMAQTDVFETKKVPRNGLPNWWRDPTFHLLAKCCDGCHSKLLCMFFAGFSPLVIAKVVVPLRGCTAIPAIGEPVHFLLGFLPPKPHVWPQTKLVLLTFWAGNLWYKYKLWLLHLGRYHWLNFEIHTFFENCLKIYISNRFEFLMKSM